MGWRLQVQRRPMPCNDEPEQGHHRNGRFRGNPVHPYNYHEINGKSYIFDREEMQILQDFESGEFESLRNFQKEKRVLEEAARSTLQKGKRINIRISLRDLERLQMRAAREEIPYQTYISSSLHKLVSGRLKEVG
jgi:predicted DNA binding CopG/RHH family protein